MDPLELAEQGKSPRHMSTTKTGEAIAPRHSTTPIKTNADRNVVDSLDSQRSISASLRSVPPGPTHPKPLSSSETVASRGAEAEDGHEGQLAVSSIQLSSCNLAFPSGRNTLWLAIGSPQASKWSQYSHVSEIRRGSTESPG